MTIAQIRRYLDYWYPRKDTAYWRLFADHCRTLFYEIEGENRFIFLDILDILEGFNTKRPMRSEYQEVEP